VYSRNTEQRIEPGIPAFAGMTVGVHATVMSFPRRRESMLMSPENFKKNTYIYLSIRYKLLLFSVRAEAQRKAYKRRNSASLRLGVLAREVKRNYS
jgi:hypothetical protein